MHLQWCGRERIVENWVFAWTWNCISVAGLWMRCNHYQTWRRSSTTSMGPHTLTKFISQKPKIKIEFDEEAKDICIINKSQGLFNMCQWLKNFSSIFGIASNQYSKKLWSFRTMSCSMKLPTASLTRKCLQSTTWEKGYHYWEKSKSNPDNRNNFLGCLT